MKYNIGDIVPFEQTQDATDWVNSAEGNYYLEDYIPDENGNMQLIVRQLVTPELTLKEQIEQAYNTFNTNIENMLDKFAKTINYKNIESACSYYNSTNEKFRNEAIYCSTIRDAIYTTCYELLDIYIPKVMSGEIAIPTWEEIKSQLPELKWPDEV